MTDLTDFLAAWTDAERTGDTAFLAERLTDDFIGVGPFVVGLLLIGRRIRLRFVVFGRVIRGRLRGPLVRLVLRRRRLRDLAEGLQLSAERDVLQHPLYDLAEGDRKEGVQEDPARKHVHREEVGVERPWHREVKVPLGG